ALSPFGTILDFGLKYETTQGWFMGAGYAVIQQDEGTVYPTLHHTIPWGSDGDVIYATFPDMPTWCRYCHEENHTKYECKKAKASILCYGCHSFGHVVAECPTATSNAPSKKQGFKKPRKSYLDDKEKTDEESSNLPPSKELLKSNYAPEASTTPKSAPISKEIAADNVKLAAYADDDDNDDDEDLDYTPNNADESNSDDDDMHYSIDEDEDNFSDVEMAGARLTGTNSIYLTKVPEDEQMNEAPTHHGSNLFYSIIIMSIHIKFNYASLNCNSLVKISFSSTQSSYLRYLRLQQYNIFSFQETHASPSTIPSLDMQLQAQQTFWTAHCGIASFSSDYILTKIPTDTIFPSDRLILCKVHHPHDFYIPFYILNLYAPADSNVARREFFDSIYHMLLHLSDTTLSLDRSLISGDFNYDLCRDIDSGKGLFKTSPNWITFLQQFFHNTMQCNDLVSVPTFQRRVGTASSIDYIYAGYGLQHSITESTISYLQPTWSDHAILHSSFSLGKSKTGPGLWRGNPQYASNPKFQRMLTEYVNDLMDNMPTNCSPQ
ncbi:MAG: hypothetical protein EXX96DRAFT_460742, partial [Benjaminiella poitrasii]